MSPCPNVLDNKLVRVADLDFYQGPGGLDNPAGILKLLVTNDDYDFGSAAWFLRSQCGPATRRGLTNGGLIGWQAYVTDCLGTNITANRQAYYERAAKVLNVRQSKNIRFEG